MYCEGSQSFTPVQTEPAAIQRKKGHFGWRLPSRKAGAFFVKPGSSRYVGNPESAHADTRFHRRIRLRPPGVCAGRPAPARHPARGRNDEPRRLAGQVPCPRSSARAQAQASRCSKAYRCCTKPNGNARDERCLSQSIAPSSCEMKPSRLVAINDEQRAYICSRGLTVPWRARDIALSRGEGNCTPGKRAVTAQIDPLVKRRIRLNTIPIVLRPGTE